MLTIPHRVLSLLATFPILQAEQELAPATELIVSPSQEAHVVIFPDLYVPTAQSSEVIFVFRSNKTKILVMVDQRFYGPTDDRVL